MKKSRCTEEQIAYALRLAEGGTPVVDVCGQMGVSAATYNTWKKKYAKMGVSELRKLQQLEDENARLLPNVSDLSLDKQMLQEVVRKRSKGCQAARAGILDARALQRQCAALVPLGNAARIGVVKSQGALRQRIRDV